MLLKKIGSYFGKLKNTLVAFKEKLHSVTDDIDIEKDIANQNKPKIDNKKNMSDNNSFTSHFIELRSRLIKSMIFILIIFIIILYIC